MRIIYNKIKRLENNEYALAMAYERLNSSINSNQTKDIYAAIGELLLWSLTTDEWHMSNNDKDYKSRRSNNESGKILLGLKYGYNLMKHNMNFYNIHKKIQGGVTFPIVFPLIFPPSKLYWEFLSEDMESGYENQIENYKLYLQGRDIITTFNKAMIFLNKENENIKKQHKNEK